MTPFQALQYNGEKTEVVFALVEFIVSGRGFQILPHSWCPGLTQHVWQDPATKDFPQIPWDSNVQ